MWSRKLRTDRFTETRNRWPAACQLPGQGKAETLPATGTDRARGGGETFGKYAFGIGAFRQPVTGVRHHDVQRPAVVTRLIQHLELNPTVVRGPCNGGIDGVVDQVPQHRGHILGLRDLAADQGFGPDA